jgi:DNA-binding GntR family transcriptional regulator
MTDELPTTSLQIRGGLADSVYVQLRAWISEGTLQPGHRLREVEIAKHFDVSTTPVREALQRLQYDGLVESHPRRGASVASVEWAETHSLLVVRELLEVHAVRRVAQTYKTHDFNGVRDILQQQAAAAAERDIPEFVRLDREFHMSIIQMAGNEPLVRITDQVHLQLQQARSRIAGNRKGSLENSLAQHQAVFEAIQRGDVEGAEAATHAHVQSTIASLAELMDPPSEDADE